MRRALLLLHADRSLLTGLPETFVWDSIIILRISVVGVGAREADYSARALFIRFAGLQSASAREGDKGSARARASKARVLIIIST